MLNVFGSVAQFEREMMLERQWEGIAKAKGEGRYKGRKPTARAKAAEIHPLAGDGVTREGIAKQLNWRRQGLPRAAARMSGLRFAVWIKCKLWGVLCPALSWETGSHALSQ
jgi:DNA invertase Pin-like site-specific DNA recombinase